MRRSEIIKGCTYLINTITQTSVHHVFAELAHGSHPQTSAGPYLNSLKDFTDRIKLESIEYDILKIFGLEYLLDPNIWAEIIFDNNRELIHDYNRRLNDILEFLPYILNLIERETEIDNLPDNATHQAITIILPENKNAISNPKRVSLAIDSIIKLYEAIARIEKENFDDLGLLNIDSGSDKSLDFIGAAKIMATLKDLFIELWDRIIYFRENKKDKKLDLISKSLKIHEQLANLEKKNEISPEEIQIIKNLIYDGTEGFIKAGAILPEFNDHNNFDPRKLTSPEKKLLLEKNVSKEELNEFSEKEIINETLSEKTTGENISTMSSEDIHQLELLLQKMKNNNSNVGKSTSTPKTKATTPRKNSRKKL